MFASFCNGAGGNSHDDFIIKVQTPVRQIGEPREQGSFDFVTG